MDEKNKKRKEIGYKKYEDLLVRFDEIVGKLFQILLVVMIQKAVYPFSTSTIYPSWDENAF